jgi:hypothetical protein
MHGLDSKSYQCSVPATVLAGSEIPSSTLSGEWWDDGLFDTSQYSGGGIADGATAAVVQVGTNRHNAGNNYALDPWAILD